MAISYDGYEFIALNEDKPLIAGDTIAMQKGIRDPHIFRGPDGAFYLAMTDLHVFGVRDGYRTTEWERDGRNMIYYVYMNDDFTQMEGEPKLLFEAPEGKYNVIDSDIMYHDGTYHLYYVSHEGGATVKHATAADIKGPYTMDENYYDGVRQGHEPPTVGSASAKTPGW